MRRPNERIPPRLRSPPRLRGRPRLRTSPTRWTRLRRRRWSARTRLNRPCTRRRGPPARYSPRWRVFRSGTWRLWREPRLSERQLRRRGSGLWSRGSRSRPNLARSSRGSSPRPRRSARRGGAAAAATDALEEAFASARAVAGREASAREAQARAEARLAAAGAETAAAEERAARADDLEIARADRGGSFGDAGSRAARRWRARRLRRASGEPRLSFGRGSWRLRGRPRTPPRASRPPTSSRPRRPSARTSGEPPRHATRTRTRTDCPRRCRPLRALRKELPRQVSQHDLALRQAVPRFLNGTRRGGARPAPAPLTADFLDSLGSRLSSVRELLASDQVRVVEKGKPSARKISVFYEPTTKYRINYSCKLIIS